MKRERSDDEDTPPKRSKQEAPLAEEQETEKYSSEETGAPTKDTNTAAEVSKNPDSTIPADTGKENAEQQGASDRPSINETDRKDAQKPAQKSEEALKNPEPTKPAEPEQDKETQTSANDQKKEKPAENASTDKPEGAQNTKSPTGFSSFKGFGGGFGGFSSTSKFGSLAKARSGAKNPWAENSTSSEGDKKVVTEKDRESPETKDDGVKEDAYAQVNLEKQEVMTGEEHEDTLFSVKVRLYAVNLESEEKQWKERGVGSLKLNKSTESAKKYRLVMRADGVLRVSLNLPLVHNMQALKGFNSSLHTEKFLRLAGIEDGLAHQFAFKLSSEEARDSLYDEIQKTLSEI